MVKINRLSGIKQWFSNGFKSKKEVEQMNHRRFHDLNETLRAKGKKQLKWDDLYDEVDEVDEDHEVAEEPEVDEKKTKGEKKTRGEKRTRDDKRTRDEKKTRA